MSVSTDGFQNIDTQHGDMIHDTQFDYYGKRLATASSDTTVKIFGLTDPSNTQQQTLQSTLQGHSGPVWQVDWAHPKWGTLLASCSYDRKVIIWREDITNGQSNWQKIYEYTKHASSVNSLKWAPHEHGLHLACASSDGTISVLSHKADDTWEAENFKAHQIGVNSVDWAPPLVGGDSQNFDKMMLASAGCDNSVRIWEKPSDKWIEQPVKGLPSAGSDWIRDVAWAPVVGVDSHMLASCCQNGSVFVSTRKKVGEQCTWSSKEIVKLPAVAWRASWSLTGNILAIASGDNKVTLWKQTHNGDWRQVSNINESGVVESPASN